MNLAPDEQFYQAQADAFRDGKFAALRDLADEFIEEPQLAAYPSPVRWLWIALLSVCSPVAMLAGVLVVVAAEWVGARFDIAALLAAPLLIASPLRRILAERKLQDTTVALLTLSAIGCALTGSPFVVLAVAALLAVKEAAVFCLPAIAAAWLVGGHAPAFGALFVGAGVALWAASVVAIFGRSALPLLKAAKAGHATPYARDHQRGAPHRLLIDLALISPACFVLSVIGALHQPGLALIALLLVAAHAFAPVRNVRTVLAAELLLRVLALFAVSRLGHAATAACLVGAIAIDVLVRRKLQNIYDPVTSALAAAFGMVKQ